MDYQVAFFSYCSGVVVPGSTSDPQIIAVPTNNQLLAAHPLKTAMAGTALSRYLMRKVSEARMFRLGMTGSGRQRPIRALLKLVLSFRLL